MTWVSLKYSKTTNATSLENRMNISRPQSIYELGREIIKSDRILVIYSKENCAPCKMLEKSIEAISDVLDAQLIQVAIIKLEDFGEGFYHEMAVRSTPTAFFYEAGRESLRFHGFRSPAELKGILNV